MAASRKDAPAKRPPLSLAAGLVLLTAATAYGVLGAKTLMSAPATSAEIANLIRSWWYASGAVSPYTATDATRAMPLYFYELGYWQQLAGVGPAVGRALSIALGALSGLVLCQICKRVTANSLAAACAVFIFLATPATAYFFALAVPAATAALLLLLAIWLLVSHLGRPRPFATILFSLLCVAMYFTRQNMILAVVVLAPLYIVTIGTRRLAQSALLIATLAVATAALLYAFPDKLAFDALRLPVVTPLIASLLTKMGVTMPELVTENGVVSTATMAFAPERINWLRLVDEFLLPNSGTILLALSLFLLAGRGLRVLWIAPLLFLWLATAHILGAAGLCSGCMSSYTPYFIATGALSAGLAIALLGRAARNMEIPAPVAMIGAAWVAVSLNAYLPMLATDPAYRLYPAALMGEPKTTPEKSETLSLARWVAQGTTPPDPILVIHGLGREHLPALPYAVFLAGRNLPAQSLDLVGAARSLSPKLPAERREAVQAAVESESLWTDDTLRRWIDRDYDVILLQEDKSIDQAALIAAIEAQFDLAATTSYRGATLRLYKRKPSQ